jgi:tRNA 5-methylaminomethyl-2-thiouridine biosynthesis bifunctional protein
MSDHQEYISPAKLRWRDQQPVSDRFDDIYFSADGPQEVRRILLRPSGILQRASKTPQSWFTIGELGFGSALNFTVTADEFVQQGHGNLHFISVEAHPLSDSDWQIVASLRPDSATAQALAKCPPPLLSGWHRRSLHGGKVQLSVFHGDVNTALTELQQFQHQPVDAWFLDGFAPSKNPDMWRREVLAKLASLSDTGTTVATFTASGQVRRDLASLGFAMEKVDQRPFKRTSLLGRFGPKTARPGHKPPNQMNVLGGGIAGASVARQLADMGIAVCVFDPAGIATGGSKMNVSALHARLLGDQSPAAEFRARAFHHARASSASFPGLQVTGALQLALNPKELEKIRRIHQVYQGDLTADQDHWINFLGPDELAKEARVEALGGLYFAGAGVVNLPKLCTALLNHPLIEFRADAKEPSPNEAWVIACGSKSRDYSLAMPLEIGDVWGQLDWIEPTSAHLPTPIVGNGYAIPSLNAWVVGSSYEQRPWSSEVATANNIDSNRQFIGNDAIRLLGHKRGPRCVSSDRDPIIGSVGHQRWVSTAHGSIGTSSAPLAGAIIASQVMGWIPPVSQRVLQSVDPSRFAGRQARRGVKVVGPAGSP